MRGSGTGVRARRGRKVKGQSHSSVLVGGVTGAKIALSPGTFLPKRGLVLTVHVQNIFCKKLCALPCPYVEDYTNQEYRAFLKKDYSGNLKFRILLE